MPGRGRGDAPRGTLACGCERKICTGWRSASAWLQPRYICSCRGSRLWLRSRRRQHRPPDPLVSPWGHPLRQPRPSLRSSRRQPRPSLRSSRRQRRRSMRSSRRQRRRSMRSSRRQRRSGRTPLRVVAEHRASRSVSAAVRRAATPRRHRSVPAAEDYRQSGHRLLHRERRQPADRGARSDQLPPHRHRVSRLVKPTAADILASRCRRTDIALLRARRTFAPARHTSHWPSASAGGDRRTPHQVFVLGYPASAGLTIPEETFATLENDKIPASAGAVADPREIVWIEANAITHGYSGGPILDPGNGAVVGIVKGMINTSRLRFVPGMPGVRCVGRAGCGAPGSLRRGRGAVSRHRPAVGHRRCRARRRAAGHGPRHLLAVTPQRACGGPAFRQRGMMARGSGGWRIRRSDGNAASTVVCSGRGFGDGLPADEHELATRRTTIGCIILYYYPLFVFFRFIINNADCAFLAMQSRDVDHHSELNDLPEDVLTGRRAT